MKPFAAFILMLCGAISLPACLGGEDVSEEEESVEEVEQALLMARCETDVSGYQTGRCINEPYAVNACMPIPQGTCHFGVKRPGYGSFCGTYANSVRCNDTAVE